jgi:methylthioribose-1-phosphate isomerase
MAVRGAPAIAIVGAFGIAMEIGQLVSVKDNSKPKYAYLISLTEKLKKSRPTAVNLSRMISDLLSNLTESRWENSSLDEIFFLLEEFSIQEFQRDIEANQKIGENALEIFSQSKYDLNIITICNTGALATAGHGTALGIIRTLNEKGYKLTVYALETRPYLQGSRLTAFEMQEEGIDCYIITDGMSSWLMNDRRIDAILVGCDRIAKNGDIANKIGTRNLAIIAKEYNVPFYVAGTKDSFDLRMNSGEEIPIEMRDPSEVTSLSFIKDREGNPLIHEGMIAPIGAKALNPSFDITPARFITKIITETGIYSPGEY